MRSANLLESKDVAQSLQVSSQADPLAIACAYLRIRQTHLTLSRPWHIAAGDWREIDIWSLIWAVRETDSQVG